MKCHKCGQELKPSAKYCRTCGVIQGQGVSELENAPSQLATSVSESSDIASTIEKISPNSQPEKIIVPVDSITHTQEGISASVATMRPQFPSGLSKYKVPILVLILVFAIGMIVLPKIRQSIPGWTVVYKTKGRTDYVDKSTITRKGAYVKIWQMSDYEELQQRGTVLSMTVLQEVNCDEGRSRILMVRATSGHMLSGEQVGREDEIMPWQDLPPGSPGRAVMNVACN